MPYAAGADHVTGATSRPVTSRRDASLPVRSLIEPTIGPRAT